MSGYNWTSNVWPVERPPAPGAERPRASWRFIGWDYFETMGIALRAGRDFTAQDHLEAPGVAIVNEAFARQEFGSCERAIGRRVRSVSGRGDEVIEIVGVIARRALLSLDTPATPRCIGRSRKRSCFRWRSSCGRRGDPAQICCGASGRRHSPSIQRFPSLNCSH